MVYQIRSPVPHQTVQPCQIKHLRTNRETQTFATLKFLHSRVVTSKIKEMSDLTIEAAIGAIAAAFGIVSWRLHLSYRVGIVSGIVTYISSATLILLNQEWGNLVAILAYYLLGVGVFRAILEYRREDPRSEENAGSGDCLERPSQLGSDSAIRRILRKATTRITTIR